MRYPPGVSFGVAATVIVASLSMANESATARVGWSILLQNDGVRYQSASFINPDTGWVLARDYRTEPFVRLLLFTENGGSTWDTIATSPDDWLDNTFAAGVAFFDHNKGWSWSSYGEVFRTTDGGRTWMDRSNRLPNDGLDGDRFRPNVFEFVSPDSGWGAGSSWQGGSGITRTTDGGATWDHENIQWESDFWRFYRDIVFLDSKHGWAVGGWNLRVTARTTNGGETWSGEFDDARGKLHGGNVGRVGFWDELHGLAVPHSGPDFQQSFVTTDGGITWKHSPIYDERLAATNRIADLEFVDGKYGWIAGGRGGADVWTWSGQIFQSSDRGESWERLDFPEIGQINDLEFPARSVGYAAADHGVLKYQGASNVPALDGPPEGNIAILITPNPAADRFFIQSLDYTCLRQVDIFNTLGTLVFSTEFPLQRAATCRHEVDRSNLPGGTYWCRIENEAGFVVTQTVVLR